MREVTALITFIVINILGVAAVGYQFYRLVNNILRAFTS